MKQLVIRFIENLRSIIQDESGFHSRCMCEYNNTCVMCGDVIPEGRMVCKKCESEIMHEE